MSSSLASCCTQNRFGTGILRPEDFYLTEHQEIYRQFVSDVELLTLDSNGRFLIPKRYLKMAGIEQGIKFIGMGDTIEIWSAANTENPFMEPEAFSKALEKVMSPMDEINEL